MCKTGTTVSKKTLFSLNDHFYRWSPKSPLEVPDVMTVSGSSGDVPGMSRADWEAYQIRIFQIKKDNS